MNRSNFFILIALLFLTSCDPNFPGNLPDDLDEILSQSTTLNIHLTDGPIDLDEVNIDLQQVFVKGPGGFQEIPLGTNAGIYNLLDFQNGKDVIISSAEGLELTQITEIRLVLGENNTVVVDGKTFDLKVPSGSQSGLKIKVCLDLTNLEQYDLILDFDAGKSVHKTGNGKYIMKPVIKVLNPDAKCKGDDDDEDDDNGEDEIPAGIAAWLEENYSGYEYEIGMTKLCGEVDAYKIKATKDQETVYIFFDLDENYLQSAFMIANAELPELVTAAAEMGYPDHNLMDNNNTFRIVTADEKTLYQVRLQKGDEKLDIVYQEDGAFVCDNTVSSDDDGEDEDEEEDEDEDDGVVTPGDLPQDVIDFLNMDYADYQFSDIEAKTLCDGTEVHVLKGNNGTNTVLLYFDLDWKFVQSAKPFNEKDLPDLVKEAIGKDYSAYKIMNNNAWEIERANSDLWYRVYIKKNNSSEKIYVIYMADGTFVCKED